MSITRVQGNTNHTTTSSLSASVTLTSAVGSGGAICGYVFFEHDSATGISVTDDKSNTYTVLDNVNNTFDAIRLVSFFAINLTNAPQTVTANWTSPSQSFVSLGAEEFSGIATASALDGHNGTFVNGSAAGTDNLSSGTFTTTVSGDLIWGAGEWSDNGLVPVTGTGFTTGLSDSINFVLTEYKIQSTAGAGTAATFTLGAGASGQHASAVGIALKAGSTPTTVAAAQKDWVWSPHGATDTFNNATSQKDWNWQHNAPTFSFTNAVSQKDWVWHPQATLETFNSPASQKAWNWSKNSPALNATSVYTTKAWQWQPNQALLSFAINQAQKAWHWAANATTQAFNNAATRKVWSWISNGATITGGNMPGASTKLHMPGGLPPRKRRSHPPE